MAPLFAGNGPHLNDEAPAAWAAALAPRKFVFPADHRAHPDYRIEWWYYTGNLESTDGRRFGYQLTFFRTGLHQSPTNPSRWAVRDLYTAHFAVSQINEKQHHCFQRNSRQGIDYAGAATDRYRVWNGDWHAWSSAEHHRLQATEGQIALDLTLSPTQPPVLHGEQGLSQKGPTPGNASYYYSYTRMPTEGTLRIDGQTVRVRGQSWMDHEFSTSFLEPGQLGWDWLSIQLDNGEDLMLYRMRRDDGTSDPFSSGTLVSRKGESTHLALHDYQMTPQGYWESSQTKARYPLQWQVSIPSHEYQLVIRPAFEAQEMTTSETTGISYWEGAIEVSGVHRGKPQTGRGYMELTGYVGEGLGMLFQR